MYKKLLSLLVLSLMIFTAACSENTPTNAEGDRITLLSSAAMSQAFATAVVGSKSKVLLYPCTETIDYTAPDNSFTVTGSITNTSEDDFTGSISVTFNNFTYADEDESITLTGTATCALSQTATKTDTTYGGSFTVLYNSVTYSYGWDVTFSMTYIPPSDININYQGSYTLDGTSYSFSYNVTTPIGD